MDNKLISVIVACYNVERYLDRCVESILGQTYSDLEIILVDDGSTDKTGQLCDCWAGRDARVQVLHKANGGLSDARMQGLKRHTGNGWDLLMETTLSVLRCMRDYMNSVQSGE